MAESEGTPPRTITVQVKFVGRTIPVDVPVFATTADLKRLLQPLTNVLPCSQRLIYKGRFLEDSRLLSWLDVVDGSKVMLIASQGLPQGADPITKSCSSSSSATGARGTSNVKECRAQELVSKSQSHIWKLVSFCDCNLKEVPEEVWECGPSVRILDVSHNRIKEIPHKIAALRSLDTLNLTANDISDETFSWEGVSCLPKLSYIFLSQNRLVNLPSTLGSLTSLCELQLANNSIESLPIEIESLKRLRILLASNNRLVNLPSTLGSLTSLCKLDLANNSIENLPIEIGSLKHLQTLLASNNRITSLPSSIGDCESLIEIDLSSNLLTELPEAFGNLHKLKFLRLKNNGLSFLPSNLFKKCSQLTTLDLHRTESTNDILRQMEGWKEFDQRRLQKHQKQLDRVGSSDEGSDDDNKRR